MQIITNIEINASPSKIWSILSDFDKYPNWNPFVKSVLGKVKTGNKIKVNVQGMDFEPTILEFTKDKELRWKGQLLFKGLFDGEHSFKLVDLKNGSTRFEHSETFKGILVPLFKKKLQTDSKAGFIAMNEELKRLSELK
ncbi:MAG: hypothetical protein ACJAZ3_001590 [Sphingobacteriales bacterium]|jgi:hypothetical protein